MARALASIVEGYGEVAALPALLRQHLSRLGADDCTLTRPHRLPPGKMFTSELSRAVELQAMRAQQGGVIILLDADDDLTADVQARLRAQCGDVTMDGVEIVVAVREYEAWFLAGIESLRRHQAVNPDATFAGNPEAPRDAKRRLASQMSQSYREVIHQPAFSSLLDLGLAAQRSPSLTSLLDAVARLVAR